MQKIYSLLSEGVREAVVVCREVTVEALNKKLNSELASAHKAHVSHIHKQQQQQNLFCKRTVAPTIERDQSEWRISRILPHLDRNAFERMKFVAQL